MRSKYIYVSNLLYSNLVSDYYEFRMINIYQFLFKNDSQNTQQTLEDVVLVASINYTQL